MSRKNVPNHEPVDVNAEAARRRDVDALIRAAGLDPEILDDEDEQPCEGQR